MPQKSYRCNYAVLSYVKDATRNVSTPVGVALWSEQAEWVGVRFLAPGESLAIIAADDYSFISFVDRKIKKWVESKHLPYEDALLSPVQENWWRHLQKILIHKVRIAEPQPIDCRDLESDLEIIFRSVVDSRILVNVGSSSASPRRLVNNVPYTLSAKAVSFASAPGEAKQFWNVFEGNEMFVSGLVGYATVAPNVCTGIGGSLKSRLYCEDNGLLVGGIGGNAVMAPYVSAGIGSSSAPEVLTSHAFEDNGKLVCKFCGYGKVQNVHIGANAVSLQKAPISGSLDDNGVWVTGSFTVATTSPAVYISGPNSVAVTERPLVSSAR